MFENISYQNQRKEEDTFKEGLRFNYQIRKKVNELFKGGGGLSTQPRHCPTFYI